VRVRGLFHSHVIYLFLEVLQCNQVLLERLRKPNAMLKSLTVLPCQNSLQISGVSTAAIRSVLKIKSGIVPAISFLKGDFVVIQWHYSDFSHRYYPKRQLTLLSPIPLVDICSPCSAGIVYCFSHNKKGACDQDKACFSG